MQNASVERLSRIISDTRPGDGNGARPRRPTFHIQIGIAEGWFSLFLITVVVYSTIWCVQAANWVAHLNVLSLTTALGLLAGLLAAKQHRVPFLPTHLIAIVLGLLIAFWQTSGADYSGNNSALLQSIHQWFVTVTSGGTSDDDSIFLLFITALGFLLAYASVWLVYRTRSPWLMIVANATVLLINLNNIGPGYIVFLVVFLMAALLLLLRFNLYESMRRWKRQGLRYADDLGWDVMQAGALISIAILILSWILPWGYINDAAAQVWNADANPVMQLIDDWNRAMSVSGGANPSNHGNFRDSLVLGGNPNLNNDVVFTATTDDPNQYFMALSYDTYDGHGWSQSPNDSLTLKAYQLMSSEANINEVHYVHQDIVMVNPPGEQKPYLLGASQIASVDVSSTVITNSSGAIVSWLGNNGKLAAGQQYSVYSYVSSADEKTLRSVPMPADAPQFPSNYDGPFPLTYYDPNVLSLYLQLPKNLDPAILRLAQQITDGAPTMYDKMVALESYLRSYYHYSVNIDRPTNEEAVSWFLFRSNNLGFCNYFATAMTVMARLLGVPARIVSGYTNGQLDTQHQQRVIRGSDAHTWTQVYFAGYGWINFEPSASFTSFDRPLPNQYNTGSVGTPPPSNSTATTGKPKPPRNIGDDSSTGSATSTPAQQQNALRQQVGLTFGAIVLLLVLGLVIFTLWWRRLFRNYTLSIQIYGRMSLLANWAGISMQRSQTPYEHIQSLVKVAPDEEDAFERIGDIYVRDRWADPASQEHPRTSGEIAELPGLWRRLQRRLFLYIARHPHFLRWLPERTWRLVSGLWARRRTHRVREQDL